MDQTPVNEELREKIEDVLHYAGSTLKYQSENSKTANACLKYLNVCMIDFRAVANETQQ